jgi:RNase P subunit RPR2
VLDKLIHIQQLTEKKKFDELSDHHHLVLTDERERGKRSDRRKRRYCTGCYSLISEDKGRTVAKQKAKKVITVCSHCPGKPAFCYECFPMFH